MCLGVHMWAGLFCSLYKRMWGVRHYGFNIIVLVLFHCWKNSAHFFTWGNLFDVGLVWRVYFYWCLWIGKRLTKSGTVFLSAPLVGHVLVFMNNHISSASVWNWDVWLQALVPVTKQVLAVLVSQLRAVPANRQLSSDVLSINWH